MTRFSRALAVVLAVAVLWPVSRAAAGENGLGYAPLPLDPVRSMEFVLPGIIAHQSATRDSAKLHVPDLRSGNETDT